jgi:hypothetical protein
MVVHAIPVQRCAELVESLTGAAPSVGWVRGLAWPGAGLVGPVVIVDGECAHVVDAAAVGVHFCWCSVSIFGSMLLWSILDRAAWLVRSFASTWSSAASGHGWSYLSCVCGT